MPGVNYRELQLKDLQNEGLTELNSLHLEMANEINRLAGVYGQVQFISDLNLQGHKIINQGCAEVGTSLQFPAGSDVKVELDDCSQWVEIETESGRKLVVSFGTLVSVFMSAHGLAPGDLIEVGSGSFEKVSGVRHATRDSKKMRVTVWPQSVYLANGVRVRHL